MLLSLQTASSSGEVSVISSTFISYLYDIANVDDKELIDNTISIAKLDKNGFL